MGKITDYTVIETLEDGRVRCSVTIPEDGTTFAFTGDSATEVLAKWRKFDTWFTPSEDEVS